MNVHDHLESASRKLAGKHGASTPARLEAEILLAHALDAPRSFLYAHSDLELPRQRSQVFQALVKRRVLGEPIAYLTGTREFWSLTLKITSDVLIPRPETELLVEVALDQIPVARPLRVADIGTGCGAIALALARERPGSEIHGTDISSSAIELARHNASELRIHNAEFHVGSWCEPLQSPFNLVASNPPYVAHDDPHLGQGDCRYEPDIALTPGTDHLSAFVEISRQAMELLEPGGWLMFEHGYEQGPAVREVLAGAGFEDVSTRHDLEGRERVSSGRR